jgi:hypothetical protein
MRMGFPDSSLRGLCIACAGRGAEGSVVVVVARVRRDMRCAKVLGGAVKETTCGFCACFRAFGARKSRYSGRVVAAAAALLNALDESWRL